MSRGLAALVDFGPGSLDAIPDAPTLDVEELLAALKQCPGYQVDKFHTNCGLRTRLGPILDYIRAMLSAGCVSVSLADWRDHRDEVSWAAVKAAADPDDGNAAFLFTRAMASDNRIRYEGQLFVNRAARALFTAETWNWTPEF